MKSNKIESLMMKYMERVFIGCLALLLPVSGFACGTTEWDGGTSGLVLAASPIDVSPVARVSQKCGMKATGQGWVQDNKPNGHTTFIARFYVMPEFTGSGQAELFIAYNNETPNTPLVKVSYDGTHLGFHAGNGVLATAPAAAGNWHIVEIRYESGVMTKFWVNAKPSDDTATGTFPATAGEYSSATGSIEAVRLGLPAGFGGFSGGSVSFDSYESHSSTLVGPLKIGDANGDDVWNIFDYGAVQNDAAGILQNGQPDCNLDGDVNIFDYGCVQLAIANN